MSICRFNFRSQALGRDVDITVTYPTTNFSYYDMKAGFRHHDAFGGLVKPQLQPGMKFQIVYLIHGGGDDDTTVYRYTNAERYANRNNVMLVTPNIVNSFGVDTNYGVQYATFLAEELPVVMQTLFASSPRREDSFIVGFAMGGNVALGMALMHPELYHTCIDMSGGIGLTVNTETLRQELRSDHFRNDFPLYNSTFGQPEALEGSRYDMHAVALRNMEQGVETPKFYLIAGSEEGFIGDRVKADADTMKAMGYDITYICADGYKHDFPLWDKYLEIAFDKILPLKRKALFD
jgi:putative tributyrin esterase